MADTKVTGGDKAVAHLQNLADRLASPPTLKVGFLGESSYANGMNVATVALINEFGATINRAEHEQTVYRLMNTSKTGFLRSGKFIKASQSNFASKHAVGAHTITIPPRPFFRTMIKTHQSEWGPAASRLLRDAGFDIVKAATAMGHLIKGELQQSIVDMDSPPNAASTIRRKGSSKPLVDTGLMLSRADFSVE